MINILLTRLWDHILTGLWSYIRVIRAWSYIQVKSLAPNTKNAFFKNMLLYKLNINKCVYVFPIISFSLSIACFGPFICMELLIYSFLGVHVHLGLWLALAYWQLTQCYYFDKMSKACGSLELHFIFIAIFYIIFWDFLYHFWCKML